MAWRLLRVAGALCCALFVGSSFGATAESGPGWQTLTPAQQQALAPLQRDWASIEPQRKQKWIEVASRFPTMPSDERARLQQRMADWARLTPAERTLARMQYQETRGVPAEERQARWQAYQALSEDERKTLAQRAKPAARAASGAASEPAGRRRADSTGSTGSKRNMVVPTTVPPVRPVAPTVVQARPGATTTTMSTRVNPPAHNQAGLPKIAATPGYVDPATLLPRRGPQGAAVRAAAASDPTEQP